MTDARFRASASSAPVAFTEWLLAVVAIAALAGGVLVEWFRVTGR